MNTRLGMIAGLVLLTAVLSSGAPLDGAGPPSLAVQKADPPASPGAPVLRRPPARSLTLSFGTAPRADIEARDAACGLSFGELEFRSGDFQGGFKVLDFSWDRADDYVVDTQGRDPWDRLHEVSAGLTRRGSVNDRLKYTLLVGVQSRFEEQCDESLSLVAGGFAIYPCGPKWAFTGGLFHSKHPKVRRDLEFMPVLGASWNARTPCGFSATLGMPKTELAWRFNEKTILTLSTSSFEGGVYRLSNTSPVREKGYVDLFGIGGMLRFETRVLDHATLGIAISQPFYRRHTLYDRDGKNKQKYQIEAMPVISLSMSMPF